MSINLSKSSQCKTNCNLHHLPCKINADGAANVGSYFHPKKTNSSLSAAFRGRPLDGKEIKLDENFYGVIMETKESGSEVGTTDLVALGEFDKVTKWYLDSRFTSAQTIDIACIEWPKNIASAIHSPVD